jgi:hypothetical protein
VAGGNSRNTWAACTVVAVESKRAVGHIVAGFQIVVDIDLHTGGAKNNCSLSLSLSLLSMWNFDQATGQVAAGVHTAPNIQWLGQQWQKGRRTAVPPIGRIVVGIGSKAALLSLQVVAVPAGELLLGPNTVVTCGFGSVHTDLSSG